MCRDCHRAVGGNPWLLGELGRQIATHGPESIAEAGDDAPPVSAIARNVIRWRLATLSAARPRGRRGAGGRRRRRAAARASPPSPASRSRELGPARDALLAAGLLDADGERLAHGLVAAAIGEDLTRTECERLHREAARALMAGRADADVVASHLLAVPAAGRSRRQRAAGARRVDGGAARRAAHRRGLPRARARGARARRRPRADARPAGDGRLRRGPARLAAAPARCAARGARPRRAASTSSPAWPRSTSSAPATPITPSCSSRSWRARAIPTCAWRSRPRRSTR